MIQGYRKEIDETKEKINPMNPPEVREQREKKSTLKIVDMEKEAREVVELFDRIA
jgi:hypothetical protein